MTETENQEEGADNTRSLDEDQQESGGNAEAAKYRRRLREVEAERDQLKERLQGLRQAEVERRVAEQLDDPSDLWRAGVQLDQLLDQDGAIQQAKVTEAATAVTAEHPAWAKRPDNAGVDEDQGKTSEGPIGASWTGLLRSGNRER